MSDAVTIAGHALREAVRRRVLLVVALLTTAFLGLYALAAFEVFESLEETWGGGIVPIDERALAGGTLLGLAMFVALFLGVVLAVFLTLGAVRGDAERGLLQPLVVRPVGRTTLLIGRLLAASAVCALYVVIVFLLAALITHAAGDFTPSSLVVPAAGLALGVVTVVAISLLGSTLLGTTANGIAIFMVFATGLAAGLLGQIGEGLDVDGLTDGELDHLVDRPVRGALPERPPRADLGHRRRDRRDRAARAVRRRQQRRRGDLAVGGGVVRRSDGAGGAGVQPPRPLTQETHRT